MWFIYLMWECPANCMHSYRPSVRPSVWPCQPALWEITLARSTWPTRNIYFSGRRLGHVTDPDLAWLVGFGKDLHGKAGRLSLGPTDLRWDLVLREGGGGAIIWFSQPGLREYTCANGILLACKGKSQCSRRTFFSPPPPRSIRCAQ